MLYSIVFVGIYLYNLNPLSLGLIAFLVLYVGLAFRTEVLSFLGVVYTG